MFKIISVEENKITIDCDDVFIKQTEHISGLKGESAVQLFVKMALEEFISETVRYFDSAKSCIEFFVEFAKTPTIFDAKRIVEAFEGSYDDVLPLLKGMQFVVDGKASLKLIYNGVEAVREGDKFYVKLA